MLDKIIARINSIYEDSRDNSRSFFSERRDRVQSRVNEVNQQRKKKSRQLRLRMATIAALGLIGLSLLCSMTGVSMLSISREACQPLATYQFYIPPLLLLVGSLLGPILFFFRRPIKWVVFATLVFYLFGAILYVAWYPILLAQC